MVKGARVEVNSAFEVEIWAVEGESRAGGFWRSWAM